MVENPGVLLRSTKAHTATSQNPGFDFLGARAQRHGLTPPHPRAPPPRAMKGALRGVLTPQDARVPRAGGWPRRRSARKGGDGGAPTHHGERSASVGAGVGVGTESLGDARAEVTCK